MRSILHSMTTTITVITKANRPSHHPSNPSSTGPSSTINPLKRKTPSPSQFPTHPSCPPHSHPNVQPINLPASDHTICPDTTTINDINSSSYLTPPLPYLTQS